MVTIGKVGVVGCGLMGSGIAQVAAKASYATVVCELNEDRMRAGMTRIERFLATSVERGKLSADERDKTLSRIRPASSLADLADVDLVVEAVVEDLDVKKDLFAQLDEVLSPRAIRCTNTSSLCVTELASATRAPDRFLGLHFFNPVPLMEVVEVIPTLMTPPELTGEVTEFARSLGKTPVIAPDRPGFLVNRLLVPYLLDAVRALEDGTGSKEDIDAGMRLGCGHPMGPFELLDFVGLDTAYYVANIMYDEFRERRFAPPPLLRRMVLAGRLGRKTGQGFYEYE